MQTKQRSKSKSIAKRAASQPASTRRAITRVPLINEAIDYDVRVIETVIPEGANYWRVVNIRHLTPEENRGKHNVYVDARNEANQREDNPALRLAWTWEGRLPDQLADPKPLDKPENEPAGNLDMYGGQYQVWIEGDGLPSERVENLRTDHPDESAANGELGNSHGHHSFYVLFQRTRKATMTGGSDQGTVTPTAPTTNGATGSANGLAPEVAGVKPSYYPEFIYGLHEPGGEQLMVDANRPGWVLALASVGLDGGSDRSDFKALAAAGLGVIGRLHHGYEPAGCLPKPAFYPAFAQACATFVARSSGCHVWIIGNEPNHAAERPQGEFIYPQQYAEAYQRCRNAIQALTGHANDQVLVAGPALWNAETRYAENQSGDWAKYFGDTLAAIPANQCDGFALHTYTRSHDPSKIKVDIAYNADGYRHLHDEFRAYRDLMAQIPAHFQHLPVLITETDPTTSQSGWAEGHNNGWVCQAYEEIADWNSDPSHQPIQALILYRWPMTDQHWWAISTRQGVIDDFTNALHSTAPDRFRIRIGASQPAQPKQPTMSVQAQIPLIFTNQVMINAFASAASSLGLSQWALLEKASFDIQALAQDRLGLFRGPGIEQMPNVTESERAILRRELLVWLLSQTLWVGLINAQEGVKLRRSPSPDDTVIAALPHEATFQVLGQVNDWLFGVANGEAGYVQRDLVVKRVEVISPQPVTPISPRVQPITVPAEATGEMLTVINAWNQFGDVITEQANQLGIDPGVAVAVLAAESGGATHSPDGHMIIRFENHIFYEQWGQANEALYRQHFRFDPNTQWQGHQWQPGDGQWRNVHTSQQNSEWAVFNFACTLDERAAMLAISMGAPQIMGFNYAAIGYTTVQAMFDAFQNDKYRQVKGFFDFVRAKEAVPAIRQQDFFTFALIYNGAGQAANYESIIRNRLALFQNLRVVGPAAATITGMARAALASLEAPAASALGADHFAQWQQQLLWVAQLSVIQQTYWLRLAAASDPATQPQILLDAANDAIRQINELKGKL